MALYRPREDNEDTAARRRSAVRTAGWVAAVAVLIYLGFILMGVLKS